jgi:SAM-dependent methyltransferase
MPNLDTSLHLDMLKKGKRRGVAWRLRAAAKTLFGPSPIYGMEWGDPEAWPPLRYMRDHFLKPYVDPGATIVEIGPGGGRWTRYVLSARRIYAVDYHQELLDELRRSCDRPNITFVKNGGDDFPGVPDGAADFIFSFGCFVHVEVDVIERYLANMRRLLKPESNVVLHYADKTKPLARSNAGFSDNDPETMRALLLRQGYAIREEDTVTMWHSALVRFGLQ